MILIYNFIYDLGYDDVLVQEEYIRIVKICFAICIKSNKISN